jgi:hypothetical protein
MLIKLIKVLISSSALVFLIGCAGINGKFDCPSQTGIYCNSVSEVNDLVDRGKLPFKKATKSKKTSVINYSNKGQDIAITSARGVKRIPEKILTVWLAPFVDKAGHYHAGSYLTAVIKPARWS